MSDKRDIRPRPQEPPPPKPVQQPPPPPVPPDNRFVKIDNPTVTKLDD
jgi:hypothetical protein